MSIKIKATWMTDSGHSWLKVNKNELIDLGIDSKISSYSYKYQDFVYLEEDCDAEIYFKAKFKNDEWWLIEEFKSIARKIPFKIYKKEAICRKYPSYSRG